MHTFYTRSSNELCSEYDQIAKLTKDNPVFITENEIKKLVLLDYTAYGILIDTTCALGQSYLFIPISLNPVMKFNKTA